MNPQLPWGLLANLGPGLRSLDSFLVHRNTWYLQSSTEKPSAGTGFAQSRSSPCMFSSISLSFPCRSPGCLSLLSFSPSLPHEHGLQTTASVTKLLCMYTKQYLHLTRNACMTEGASDGCRWRGCRKKGCRRKGVGGGGV